jgi:hypothetical protein
MIFLEKAGFFGSYKSIGYDAYANRVFGNSVDEILRFRGGENHSQAILWAAMRA